MEQLRPSSLQHNAYREIKRRIVTLAYRPGEQINTARICSQLRIGRTPVHLAIHRLEIEGLIEILPRRGVVVRPIDRAEIMELIEARLLVEPEIAALASARASEREFAALRAALDRIPPHLEAGDSELFMEADCEFHRTLARAARNRPLSDLLASLHERCVRVYFISVSSNEQDVRIVKEHEDIFAALVRRDSRGAAAAMRQHIDSLRNNVRASLSS
ncbi:MAG: GntR family transcriptional regulator [Alphaproteobacteria bacterium]